MSLKSVLSLRHLEAHDLYPANRKTGMLGEKLNASVSIYLHSCPKLKLQPVLSLSYFLHNSSINEHKNMKLRENICFEIIN